MTRPFRAALNAARCSGEGERPFLAALSFARCSALNGRPRFAAAVFSTASIDIFRPTCQADILARDSADRFWPMPLAAMQGVSVLAHVAELIRPDLAQNVYTNAVQLWSYPQLVLLFLGTLRVDLRRYDYRLGRWPLPR